MYDIIYLYDIKKENRQLKSLRERFPLIKVFKYDDNISEALTRAKKSSMTKFFWVIHLDTDFVIDDSFNFDYIVTNWDKEYVHVWKKRNNLDDNLSYDSVFLIPKDYSFSKRELSHLFFVNKKEIDQVASFIQPYDIIFISYNEPNANENWLKLVERFPRAQRVHGVKGIHNAHVQAARLSNTSMFWVVDGDSEIKEDFNFDYVVDPWDRDAVFVWKSQNPINDLSYGNGGVKLLPKFLTMDLDTSTIDMTTSISKKFNSIDEVSNLTIFNTDPFNTWKSAFRECVKLSSKVIDGQIDMETETRLDVWCTGGIEKPYGEYAIKGAIAGKEFGTKYINDTTELSKINDWQWLEYEFRKISEK